MSPSCRLASRKLGRRLIRLARPGHLPEGRHRPVAPVRTVVASLPYRAGLLGMRQGEGERRRHWQRVDHSPLRLATEKVGAAASALVASAMIGPGGSDARRRRDPVHVERERRQGRVARLGRFQAPAACSAPLGDSPATTGLREIRWHDLRHSFASQLVSAGVPVRQTQDWLGHSTITMTVLYSHLAPGRVRRALGHAYRRDSISQNRRPGC